ncbi:hypothetical protein BJI48_05725 [Helicobacter sp. 11S02596-1]|nr:hypothetical protein BJI48_05725 [Helicobacter sp. 11S02596-1]
MDAPNFIPQVVKNCENINEQLQQFSLTSKISLDHLWFDILDVHTSIKLHEKDEYHLITGNEIAQFEKDAFYTKEDFFVQQTYDIRIKPKTKDYGLTLEITPMSDKMHLVPDNHFSIIDDEHFYEEVFGVIDSLMAQNNIIFRQQHIQRQNLKIHLQELCAQGIHPQKILLKTAPDLTPYQNAEFIFTLQKEWEKNGREAPKNSFFGVSADEVIAEYIKPVQGKSGRNLKGEYIKMDTKAMPQMPPIQHNKNLVRQEETQNKVIFKSQIPAYVKIEDNAILFNTNYEFSTIKTTNTPMLLGGVKSGLTITIESENEFIDAIEANMIIEASNIHIIGSIGENVELSAQKITIEGQTHQSSTIYSQEAKITTHKGKFYGDVIEIKNLDTGFVQADECTIEIASGSEVYAKKIKIDTLKSNNKLHFSQECLIKENQGGENKFVISASADNKTKQAMEFIDKKISLLKTKMRAMAQEYQFLITKAKENKPIIDKIKSAPKDVQKAMLNESDIKKTYHHFITSLKKLKILKRELLKLQNTIKELYTSLFEIENETLSAKILAQTEWKLENQIIYHRDYPKSSDEVLLLEDGESADIAIDPSSKKIKKIK